MSRRIKVVYDGGQQAGLDWRIRTLFDELGYELIGGGLLLATGERDLAFEERDEEADKGGATTARKD